MEKRKTVSAKRAGARRQRTCHCEARGLRGARRRPRLALHGILGAWLSDATRPERTNRRTEERSLDPTPRPARLEFGGGRGRPAQLRRPRRGPGKAGRGKAGARRRPRVTARPAPGGGTCASPGGHGARPAARAHTRARARAPQPAARPARPSGLARAPAAPRACARWGAHPSRPARPATPLPTLGARPSYLRAGDGGERKGRGGRTGPRRGAAGERASGRGGRFGRVRARARSRPRSFSRLRATAQPCCRAPPASPRLITTAPGVRWPRADSAAIGPAGSAARQDWLEGGASAGQGRSRGGRRAGGGGGGARPRSAPLCRTRALRPLRLQRRLHQ